ncbi:conserved Plasmodium protein, unknown function [Plasmodium knowlesi strain H]|uniref:Uncharacterized protein n=3 Tax=Plasmodium knowlesi TaxID=5850 RepID=A0A5K1V9J6_PLAKH|nr:conserved Plasmodium protein, unknown function [Plasmodium knowlesi strain H]OTN63872.1 Uncharacterized protein PKNOH_S140223100 [Plasmodium knowlesi]CAA9990659.1 conserved Plasmodium protein, unknown function [Plasmodium knowlesi strain H]SBO25970.1 conserved Plasmodium protein, unknown function [Plasmodium knowlesi strain H]SBO28699.1 conserved Plasmodium protein, unknown function [Plasmodium knowlesi strain H]VVS80133.1 conserved Plasmodium protein, unknown function [Plasmodium knowlesi |eukprot:XP_002261950.1 hypothetical protein, conserved in Plasmodium species [Plasmodium knowlesi strain H]
MSKLENQIKQIESNIIIKEKKIQDLEREIQELKNYSKGLYEKLINQQEVLLKRKKQNVLTDIKINRLKKDMIELCKAIHNANRKITNAFAELKKKKFLIKENTQCMEEIYNDVIKKNVMHNEQNNTTLTILNHFFIKKGYHNDDLKLLLKDKKEKIRIVKNQIKEMNNNITTKRLNIALLDSRLIANLHTIKSYIKELIQMGAFQKININKKNIRRNCLHIINNVIDKQESTEKNILDPHTDDNQMETADNNVSTENREEEKLELQLNTQEFIQLENFLL